jgi:protein SCO1/2/putative membrane protein
MRRGARATWALVLASVAFAGAARGEETAFQVYGEPLRTFTLTDHTGKPFKPEQLRGKAWVAHFFFTTCTAGCSQTNQTMMALQERFRGVGPVAFVSISVHPEQDTPEVLARFASQAKAEPGQWYFLRGAESDVYRILQESFFVTAGRTGDATPGREVRHDWKLMLIGPEGRIEGYVGDGKADNAADVLERVLRRGAPLNYFPTLNAGLNTLCAVLLLAGYVSIRLRRERLHKVCMLAALATSAVFLSCYLWYHFAVLNGKPTRFPGEGALRWAYLAILLSHTILAALVAPLALWVSYLGLADRRETHRRWAKRTFPLWLYVSVTGVVVYWMLYRL